MYEACPVEAHWRYRRGQAVLIGPALAFVAAYYAFYDEAADDTGNGVAATLAYLWLAVLAISAVMTLLDRRRHRGLHDLAGRTQVVLAARRGIQLRTDAKMLVPGRVHLEGRAPSPPVLLSKQ